jgi:hypothetical protein
MKNLIIILLFLSIYSSCKKDNTVIPNTPYAYDSLHKSIIGEWVFRYRLGGVGKLDTYSFYTITYDSIYFSNCKNYSNEK